MKTDRELIFNVITLMLCFAVGSSIMIADLMTVPKKGTPQFQEMYPNWTVGESVKYEEQRRFWEWEMGNGYVSPIENAVMTLALFFGFMRMMDLVFTVQRVEKERGWIWFWNLCEGNESDNNH